MGSLFVCEGFIMTVLSKLKLSQQLFIETVKQHTNLSGGLMAAWVIVGGTVLFRGIVRDRQSSTAAITSKLIENQKETQKQRQQNQNARLTSIIKIICPGWKTKESWYLIFLSVLLIARTVFSVITAEMVGNNVMNLVNRDFLGAARGVFSFLLLAFPAAFINSYIKLVSQVLALRFRLRLSKCVNKQYIKGVNFYAACNLHGIHDVDQRVTTDIKQFSEEVAGLFSSLFKPILDILLFTNQLRRVTGWQGPAFMYSYFLISALLKRIINRRAKFGKLVAGESAREGHYRTAHQRLITNSEEIAFYNGSVRELSLVEQSLSELFNYARNQRYVRAVVDLCDQLLIKYWATIAGYFVMWIPILLNNDPNKSSGELTRDYARVSRYLQNVSAAVGELVLVINTLATISGRTRRVSELLETVEALDLHPTAPFKRREVVRERRTNPWLEGIDEWLTTWKERCDQEYQQRINNTAKKVRHLENGGTYVQGEIISFEGVDIISPEGTCLAKDLNFKVEHNQNVMITGPNGCGKSSLFRVIGELWPLSCGTLIKPPKEDFLFVPQKPYLVTGSLRDQLIYPHSHKDMLNRGVTDDDLSRLLALVDPANDILNTWNFDEEKDWFRAFSGGQKQRVAMARVFYHRPAYAILDECTSAVSSEVEHSIYEVGNKLGITLFTVSHRESLRRHHKFVLFIEGDAGKWHLTNIEDEYRG